MKTLDLYLLLRLFLPVLIIALLLFTVVIQLLELIDNLVRYIEREATPRQVLVVLLQYLPKSISYALPIATLFACSFTLGLLYNNNEMMAIFGSGIPLRRAIASFLLAGLLISVGNFWFEERIVIDSLNRYNNMKQDLLSPNRNSSGSNTRVAAFDEQGRRVYYADSYRDSDQTLRGVIIIERDQFGQLIQRIDAQRAVWNETHWRLEDTVLYRWDANVGRLVSLPIGTAEAPALSLPPETFRRGTNRVNELPTQEAFQHIESLRLRGLPFRTELTDFHKRFSFALTPLMVIFLSSVASGHFRKNILLMSLLASLALSVIYYVAGLLADVLATSGYISPLFAAWSPLAIFAVIGFGLLFFSAR